LQACPSADAASGASANAPASAEAKSLFIMDKFSHSQLLSG
jgi:hypothetical protein